LNLNGALALRGHAGMRLPASFRATLVGTDLEMLFEQWRDRFGLDNRGAAHHDGCCRHDRTISVSRDAATADFLSRGLVLGFRSAAYSSLVPASIYE